MKQACCDREGKQREDQNQEVRFDAYAHTSDLEECEEHGGLTNQVTRGRLKVSAEVWKEAGAREKGQG